MRKKNIIFNLVIIFIFIVGVRVDAASCSTSELNELKSEANNMTFSYELINESPGSEDEGWDEQYYYILKVYDYDSNFIINYSNNYYDSNYVNSDGDLVIDKVFTAGTKITFNIYGAENTNCSWKVINTKTITFPYYNKYSEYEECVGYENLNICNSTSNTESITTDEQFLSLLEKAKEEALSAKQESEEENATIFEKIIDFYLEYKIITIPITLIIVVLIVLIIVIANKQRKKKVKIDLGGKL